MLYDLNIDSIQAGTIYGRQEWLQKFAALKNSIIEAINDNGKDSLKYLYQHIHDTDFTYTFKNFPDIERQNIHNIEIAINHLRENKNCLTSIDTNALFFTKLLTIQILIPLISNKLLSAAILASMYTDTMPDWKIPENDMTMEYKDYYAKFFGHPSKMQHSWSEKLNQIMHIKFSEKATKNFKTYKGEIWKLCKLIEYIIYSVNEATQSDANSVQFFNAIEKNTSSELNNYISSRPDDDEIETLKICLLRTILITWLSPEDIYHIRQLESNIVTAYQIIQSVPYLILAKAMLDESIINIPNEKISHNRIKLTEGIFEIDEPDKYAWFILIKFVIHDTVNCFDLQIPEREFIKEHLTYDETKSQIAKDLFSYIHNHNHTLPSHKATNNKKHIIETYFHELDTTQRNKLQKLAQQWLEFIQNNSQTDINHIIQVMELILVSKKIWINKRNLDLYFGDIEKKHYTRLYNVISKWKKHQSPELLTTIIYMINLIAFVRLDDKEYNTIATLTTGYYNYLRTNMEYALYKSNMPAILGTLDRIKLDIMTTIFKF